MARKYWISTNPKIYIDGSSNISSTATAIPSSALAANSVGHIRVKVEKADGTFATLLIPLMSSTTSS